LLMTYGIVKPLLIDVACTWKSVWPRRVRLELLQSTEIDPGEELRESISAMNQIMVHTKLTRIEVSIGAVVVYVIVLITFGQPGITSAPPYGGIGQYLSAW
jgi:hypothetical protein